MNKAFKKYGKYKFKDIISERHPLYVSTKLKGMNVRLVIGGVTVGGFRIKGVVGNVIRYKKSR